MELDEDLLNEFNESSEWADEIINSSSEDVSVMDTDKLIVASQSILGSDGPSQDHIRVLKSVFGHQEFRSMQWKIINTILKDKRDNCAVMATGYGKSLCYQFPPVYANGVAVVVSPLISLMEDQVLALKVANIPACLLGSANTHQAETIKDIFQNRYNLIYITPEFCCGMGMSLIADIKSKLNLVLIAIDESHCVSTWGHDFRYSYRELGKLKVEFPGVPILAVTATATPRVRDDIIKSLKLRNPQILCSGFDRPNLYFSSSLKSKKGIFTDIRTCMTEENGDYRFDGSTIIYCITRKQTEEIATVLSLKGVECAFYHAGMTLPRRKETHENFLKDRLQCVVATVAFGMGIDKPDVRNIIHYGASKDIESYYQEVGRAGRDGQPAKCFMFFGPQDFITQKFLREKGSGSAEVKSNKESMEKLMQEYLESHSCRRQFILNHFEGIQKTAAPRLNCCDNCSKKLERSSESYQDLNERGEFDFTSDGEIFLSTVETMGGNFGLNKYILFMRGSRSSILQAFLLKHALHGKGKHRSDDWWKAVGNEIDYDFQQINVMSDPKLYSSKLAMTKIKYVSPGGEGKHGVVSLDESLKFLIMQSTRILEKGGYLLKKSKKNEQVSYFTYELGNKGTQFLKDYKSNKSPKILLEPTPQLLPLLKKKVTSELKGVPPSRFAVPTISNAAMSIIASSSVSRSVTPASALRPVETKECREEKLKLYKVLTNLRAQIASDFDCMQYTVASNEAMMQMATLKPITVQQLRDSKLDQYTEAKITKFGLKFIEAIRDFCKIPLEVPCTAKDSVRDIIMRNPLPSTRITPSAESTYSLFEKGFTVYEITKTRGVVTSTVFSHLIDCMKGGFPIKMSELGVTREIAEQITNIIRKPPISNNMSTITPIKNECPAEITYENIRIVVTYLQLREQLDKLALPYEEFEDFTFEDFNGASKKANETCLSQAAALDKLIELAGDDKEFDAVVTAIKDAVDEPALKRKKLEETDEIFDVLDSPPRC